MARVRWPDVFQAISAARPGWQDDPGLFDLPYANTSIEVSVDEASRIATEWGAQLPSDDELGVGPSLIRRMPTNWARLSPAERRSWGIILEHAEQPNARQGWWARRRRTDVSAADEAPTGVTAFGSALVHDAVVIDLNERRHDEPADDADRSGPDGTDSDVMVGNA